ncbi:MAG TPA: class I SAM-dependent methyltransferase [Pseudolabrys sp.]|nr:class I SAM-dependent methyltransferase [Pseudolabrys sp.]
MQRDQHASLGDCGINIGAGRTYIPSLINIDFAPYADISLDLNKDRLPFEDNSINLVFSYHTLEHLDNYLFAMAEIHRVMKHGGRLLVGVPYITLTQYNLVNPYHRQNFNEYSFDFFDPKLLLGSAAEQAGPMFRKVFHRFHYLPELNNKSERRKEWCRRHLFNVVQKIDFGLIALKQGWPDIEVDDAMPAQFLEEFEKLLRSRKKYSCHSATG